MSFHTIEYSAGIGSPSTSTQLALGNVQGGQAAAHGIFTYDGGIPMLFFVPFTDPNRHEYKQKIINHGGIITDTEPNESTGNRIILLSSFNIRGQLCFKLSFVDDSIKNNGVCDLNNYKYQVPEVYDPLSISGRNKMVKVNSEGDENDGAGSFTNVLTRAARPLPVRTSRRFNDLKDEYILKQIRLNPRLRNSHKFFDGLATHDVLKGHTGNSIRSRYRNHLESRLAYVYKTDEDGGLIKSADGKNIRESLENLPKTLKNRFTALEDFNLCTELVDYSKQKYYEDLESGVVDKDADGKPKPFDPYQELTAPVSFFTMMAKNYPTHSYHSWRDRYRKFVRQYGAQKFIDDYNTSIQNGETPEQMKNFTGKKAGLAKGFKQLIGSSYTEPFKGPSNEVEPASDDVAIDEKLKLIKSSGYKDVEENNDGNDRHDTEVNNVLEEVIDSQAQLQSQGQDSLNTDSQSTLQEWFQLDIKYLPQTVTLEELFNKNFYKILPAEISAKVENILGNMEPTNAAKLLKSFNDIGINDVFTGHIIMAANADIVKMQIFVEKFLNLIPHLLEDQIYTALQFEDTEGLWTSKLDNYIFSGSKSDMAKLEKIQSPEAIEARREFLVTNGLAPSNE